jgi:hypothetical protein
MMKLPKNSVNLRAYVTTGGGYEDNGVHNEETKSTEANGEEDAPGHPPAAIAHVAGG